MNNYYSNDYYSNYYSNYFIIPVIYSNYIYICIYIYALKSSSDPTLSTFLVEEVEELIGHLLSDVVTTEEVSHLAEAGPRWGGYKVAG